MAGTYTDKMTFPNKHGDPQPITPPAELNLLEKATRVAFLLQLAIERKKEFEAQQKKKDNWYKEN
jgi:hypothetical protein